MTDRRPFLLFAAMFAVVAFVPTRADHTPDFMTPVPVETVLAAMPQGVPDAACIARCATSRDRGIAAADKLLKERGYFSVFSSNCTEATGQPRCASLRQACREACAPKYDNACTAACETPFQTCCHSNDVAWEGTNYDACVVKCPASKAPPPPPPPPPPPAGDQGTGATTKQKSQWTSLVSAANAMLDTVGLDKIPAGRVDDMLRSLAFLQARASMAVHGSKYTVVSGGAGRIWLLTSDGKQVLLNNDQSDMVRGPKTGMWTGPAYEKTLQDMTTLTGLTMDEAKDCINQVRLANQKRQFAAGEMLEFPPWQGWPQGALASSEHSSIRGTINGGGDFI